MPKPKRGSRNSGSRAVPAGAMEYRSAAGPQQKERQNMNKGRITQVMGPVVDVLFEDGDLPFIKDALEVENNGKKCIMA